MAKILEFGSPLESDNRTHEPADPSPWWQESAMFTWGDPRSGFGGEVRFGMHPNQGAANLYTWTLFEGELVDRRLIVEQPLPEQILDGAIAGARVRTRIPLLEYEIELQRPDLSLHLHWRSFRTPLTMGYNIGGATLANGHYNAMGVASGHGSYKGKAFEFNAAGFSDHSWGVRRAHLPASRSLFCVFDEDFYIMAIPVHSGTTAAMVGYVYDRGKLGALADDAKMGYSFRDDWITPAGCDARLYDQHHRGYHLTGYTIGGSSTQSLGHGKLVTHAVAGFECGGRLGRGILESSQVKKMFPAQIEQLGVGKDSWWLNEHAE